MRFPTQLQVLELEERIQALREYYGNNMLAIDAILRAHRNGHHLKQDKKIRLTTGTIGQAVSFLKNYN